MSSTIETLERELGEAQLEREERQRAVKRADNAHDAACAARDEAWSEASWDKAEVERLSSLVYQRRREMYETIDGLKAAEGKERRIKSRLMYVLPAERRRYLSGGSDEELEALLESMRRAYAGQAPELEVAVVGEEPGEVDLRGDATWRALERLYSGTARSWIEVRSTGEPDTVCALARHISHYAGGHIPRAFVAGEELGIEKVCASAPAERWRSIESFEGEEGRLTLARITARRYLDESTVGQLGKHPEKLARMAEIARLYQTMSLTGDEIRWRMEQLIPLRLEPLHAIYHLTGERRRFSFYEIARAARLLDGHFPDAGVAAEALSHAVERALESGVPLVDAAYLNVTAGEWP